MSTVTTPDRAGATTSTAERGAVVVGVDGTAGSAAAVRWAAAEAARRGVWLRAIHVVDREHSHDGPLEPDPQMEIALGRRTIPSRVAAQAQLDDLDVHVSVRVVAGHVADELVHASRDAALLVLGATDGVARDTLPLPGVSECPCPVAVVSEDGDVQFFPGPQPFRNNPAGGGHHARA